MNWFKSSETLPVNNDKYLVYTHAGEFELLWWDGGKKIFYRHYYDSYIDSSVLIQFGPAGAPFWSYLEAPK